MKEPAFEVWPEYQIVHHPFHASFVITRQDAEHLTGNPFQLLFRRNPFPAGDTERFADRRNLVADFPTVLLHQLGKEPQCHLNDNTIRRRPLGSNREWVVIFRRFSVIGFVPIHYRQPLGMFSLFLFSLCHFSVP